VSGTSELNPYDTQVQKREMLRMLIQQELKHLHNVETHLYCPQTFLYLDFQCRDDVSEWKQTFRDREELADAYDCNICLYLKGVQQHRRPQEQPQALHTGSCTQQGRWGAGTC